MLFFCGNFNWGKFNCKCHLQNTMQNTHHRMKSLCALSTSVDTFTVISFLYIFFHKFDKFKKKNWKILYSKSTGPGARLLHYFQTVFTWESLIYINIYTQNLDFTRGKRRRKKKSKMSSRRNVIMFFSSSFLRNIEKKCFPKNILGNFLPKCQVLFAKRQIEKIFFLPLTTNFFSSYFGPFFPRHLNLFFVCSRFIIISMVTSFKVSEKRIYEQLNNSIMFYANFFAKKKPCLR
jgi:hypothetical protein